jgi:dCMP deaminase
MCCAACARTLIQAGIKRVVFGDGKTSMPDDEFEAAAVMFREAGVECVPA